MKSINVVLEKSEPFYLAAGLGLVMLFSGWLLGAAKTNEHHANDVQLCEQETGVPCVLMAVPAPGVDAQ